MVKTVQNEAERVVRSLIGTDKIIEAMIKAGIASWHFVVYNGDGSILCRGEGGEQLRVRFGRIYAQVASLERRQCMISPPNSPQVQTRGVWWVAHVSQRGLVCIVAFKPADDVVMNEQIPGRRDGSTYAAHMVKQAENAAVLLGIGLGHLFTEFRAPTERLSHCSLA